MFCCIVYYVYKQTFEEIIYLLRIPDTQVHLLSAVYQKTEMCTCSIQGDQKEKHSSCHIL